MWTNALGIVEQRSATSIVVFVHIAVVCLEVSSLAAACNCAARIGVKRESVVLGGIDAFNDVYTEGQSRAEQAADRRWKVPISPV